MSLELTAYGWHATIFLGWELLLAAVVSTVVAVILVRCLSGALTPAVDSGAHGSPRASA